MLSPEKLKRATITTTMTRQESSPLFNFEILTEDESATITAIGALDVYSSEVALKQLSKALLDVAPKNLTIDLAQLQKIDDFGVVVLACLKSKLLKQDGNFQLSNISPASKEILDFHHFEQLCQPALVPPPIKLDIFTRLGDKTIRLLGGNLEVISFLGSTGQAFWKVIRSPRTLRETDFVEALQTTGVDALPIVGLISFLLGLIMAFMSAVQLEQFGANVYVASLVGLSMTRELGPIMTCILVAGRSSSSYASEIGTMQISEEIDALKTMAIDPHLFLVVPRVIAATLVVPLLTLFSDLFAMLGGLFIGVSMLGLTVNSYLSQTVETLEPFDFLWGMGKSALFAVLIAWTGCLKGFMVRGGPAAVGRATTSAVVTSIFLIILADSIFAVIIRYFG